MPFKAFQMKQCRGQAGKEKLRGREGASSGKKSVECRPQKRNGPNATSHAEPFNWKGRPGESIDGRIIVATSQQWQPAD